MNTSGIKQSFLEQAQSLQPDSTESEVSELLKAFAEALRTETDAATRAELTLAKSSFLDAIVAATRTDRKVPFPKKLLGEALSSFLKEKSGKGAESPPELKPPTLEQSAYNMYFLPYMASAYCEEPQAQDAEPDLDLLMEGWWTDVQALMEGSSAEDMQTIGEAFRRDAKLLPHVLAARELLRSASEKLQVAVHVDYDGRLHKEVGRDGGPTELVEFCPPVLPISRGGRQSDDGGGWTLRLLARTPDGAWIQIDLPYTEMTDRGNWLRLLQDKGLMVSDPTLLLAVLKFAQRNAQQLKVVAKCGWQSDDPRHDASTYVLGQEALTRNGSYPVLVPGGVDCPPSGTLDEWRDHIAARAEGNQSLAEAILWALAAPAKRMFGVPSGGVNTFAKTSVGKTTAAYGGLSVFAPPGQRRTWDMSGAAFYRLAPQHNDCVLLIDDTAKHDHVEVFADITYAAGNGTQAARAGRGEHDVRRTTTFHIDVLSTGEESIETTLAKEGQKRSMEYRFGQESRMPNVPFTPITELHGARNGREFVERYSEDCARYYGTAGRAVIQLLMDETILDEIERNLRVMRDALTSSNSDGQEHRVNARFALAAVVGELCIEQGILPWQPGYPTTVMKRAFAKWIATRGGRGSPLVLAGRRKLDDFCLSNRLSRFEEITDGMSHTSYVAHICGYLKRRIEYRGTYFTEIIVPSDRETWLFEMTNLRNSDLEELLKDYEERTLEAVQHWDDGADRPSVMILTPKTRAALTGSDGKHKGLTVQRMGGPLGKRRRSCYVFLIEEGDPTTQVEGEFTHDPHKAAHSAIHALHEARRGLEPEQWRRIVAQLGNLVEIEPPEPEDDDGAGLASMH